MTTSGATGLGEHGDFTSLGILLCELKHTIGDVRTKVKTNNKPVTFKDTQAVARDKINVVVHLRQRDQDSVVLTERKIKMQVPVGTMFRLQDYLEDKLKILKSLQRVYCHDVELQPNDLRPFITHNIVDGEELLIVEDCVTITLKLPEGRKITLRRVFLTCTVNEIKSRIECLTGLPYCQQRLRFLEDEDLGDTSILYDVGVVPNAHMSVHLWSDWAPFFKLVRADNLSGLQRMVESTGAIHSGPWSALFLAAFEGRHLICRMLMALGVDPCIHDSKRAASFTTGRTPIHAAAGQGQLKCLQELVLTGIRFYEEDNEGIAPELWAKQNGHGPCADMLAMARWDLRDLREMTALKARALTESKDVLNSSLKNKATLQSFSPSKSFMHYPAINKHAVSAHHVMAKFDHLIKQHPSTLVPKPFRANKMITKSPFLASLPITPFLSTGTPIAQKKPLSSLSGSLAGISSRNQEKNLLMFLQ